MLILCFRVFCLLGCLKNWIVLVGFSSLGFLVGYVYALGVLVFLWNGLSMDFQEVGVIGICIWGEGNLVPVEKLGLWRDSIDEWLICKEIDIGYENSLLIYIDLVWQWDSKSTFNLCPPFFSIWDPYHDMLNSSWYLKIVLSRSISIIEKWASTEGCGWNFGWMEVFRAFAALIYASLLRLRVFFWDLQLGLWRSSTALWTAPFSYQDGNQLLVILVENHGRESPVKGQLWQPCEWLLLQVILYLSTTFAFPFFYF